MRSHKATARSLTEPMFPAVAFMKSGEMLFQIEAPPEPLHYCRRSTPLPDSNSLVSSVCRTLASVENGAASPSQRESVSDSGHECAYIRHRPRSEVRISTVFGDGAQGGTPSNGGLA